MTQKRFRMKTGSLAQVKRVLAYDDRDGRACVLFHSEYRDDFFEVVLPEELELTRDGVQVDVREELKRIADVVTGEYGGS